ncbi:MAG: tyrosine-type recombinase/integrase [Jiangellaceae bacterium]
MAYIVNRRDRFYVVAYDGIDPISGRERRRWHPAGTTRDDAEDLSRQLERDLSSRPTLPAGRGTTLGRFLVEDWLPRKRRTLAPTTAYRYAWIIDHYVVPRLGHVHLRRLRADHFDDVYTDLLSSGSRGGGALSPKTVLEVHVLVRGALDDACRRRLVVDNVAAHATRPCGRSHRVVPERWWTRDQLTAFLACARDVRLYPALHVAAYTGMRRGEILGLHWGDLDVTTRRLSVSRNLQLVGTTPVEASCKTRSSRRCIDLDSATVSLLQVWRDQQAETGCPVGPDDPVFTTVRGQRINPDVLSQTFGRVVLRSGLRRIRLHDLRHTHASLLVQDGVPIKVVSERLGHSHPAFTMATYQHVLPGMQADAAARFAKLLEPL